MRRWTTPLLVVALVGALAFAGWAVVASITSGQEDARTAKTLAERINEERYNNTLESCKASNDRYANASLQLDRLLLAELTEKPFNPKLSQAVVDRRLKRILAGLPREQRIEAELSRKPIEFLIRALAPRTADCVARAERQVNAP